MEPLVKVMALLRVTSGSIEIIAALLMLYFGTVSKALQINGALALVGPTVLITVSAIGTIQLASNTPIWRITLLVIGVGLILIAAKR